MQVKKQQVDNRGQGSCQLRLKWTRNGQPGELVYRVKLIGTKDPSTCLTIESDPQPLIPPGQWLITPTWTSELTQYYMGEHMTLC